MGSVVRIYVCDRCGKCFGVNDVPMGGAEKFHIKLLMRDMRGVKPEGWFRHGCRGRDDREPFSFGAVVIYKIESEDGLGRKVTLLTPYDGVTVIHDSWWSSASYRTVSMRANAHRRIARMSSLSERQGEA